MADGNDWDFMRRAVDLGKCSQRELDKPASPRVGVVIVQDGIEVTHGFRGERNAGEHAEYCALSKLPEEFDLSGAIVYTTLEPCSRRNHPKVPCARRLADRGVSRVVIGMYDPDPRIHREGWRILREASVRLGDFPAELRAEIRADNCDFLDKFRLALGESGEAVFDPVQSADFFLGNDANRVRTHWSGGGDRAVFAYGEGQEAVVVVRHAQELNEVGDPSSYVFPRTHVVDATINDIVVFRSPRGAYGVVKLLDIRKVAYGADRNEIRFQWQLRVPRVT